MVDKSLSFLLLFAGLFLLASCQAAEVQETVGAATPLPSLTRSVEQSGREQPDAREQEEEDTPPPSPTTSQVSAFSLPRFSTPTSMPPVRGGQVVVGGVGAPDTLNPLVIESEAGRRLTPLLFDSLLASDPDSGEPSPSLAETWQVSDEGQTITFTLRSDALWHDGQPVVAGDVVFTIEAARDPALDSLYGPRLGHVSGAAAPDDVTVVIGLDQPDCPSLAVLGALPILPQHLLADSDLIGTPYPGKGPAGGSVFAGSGPFVLTDWTPDGEVHLARNDDYWGGAPYLETWSYRPFETIAGLELALETGEVDVALMPPGVRLSDPSDSSLSPGTDPSVYHYPAPQVLFVAFNGDHPVLSAPQVRQALSMAVDRDQLIDEVLGGAGELVASSLPSLHWASDPTLQPPPYDPDGARQLLAEAGWTDSDGDGWLDQAGGRLRLPVRTNGGNRLREDVATLLAGYYRAVGVDASVELVGWGALVDDLFTHDFELIIFSWPLRAEPDQSQWWLSTEDEVGTGYNFVSFADERVDRWLQEALAVPDCDPARRAELYRQVQGVLAEERPYDFLLMPYATVLTRPELYGLVAGPFSGPLESAAGWYLGTSADR